MGDGSTTEVLQSMVGSKDVGKMERERRENRDFSFCSFLMKLVANGIVSDYEKKGKSEKKESWGIPWASMGCPTPIYGGHNDGFQEEDSTDLLYLRPQSLMERKEKPSSLLP